MIFRSQLCGVCVSDSSGYRYFMFEYYHIILLFEMLLNSMVFNEALESEITYFLEKSKKEQIESLHL